MTQSGHPNPIASLRTGVGRSGTLASSALGIVAVDGGARTNAGRPWQASLWSAEQKVEEARAAITPATIAGAAIVATAAIHADRHTHRLRRSVRGSLNRDVGNLALAALEDRYHPGVSAVHVLTQLQLAGVIHEGGLIGQVDRDDLRKADIDLAVAKQCRQPRLGVVLVR